MPVLGRARAASDDQVADAVWSDVHAAVWHLSPGVNDASGYGHDGVQTRGVHDSEGQLAGAKELFDVDDRIDVPPGEVLDDVCIGGATLSAWVRPDTFGGTDCVSEGFEMGTPTCDDRCMLDTSACCSAPAC